MNLVEYLNEYPLPEKEEDMTLEQTIIDQYIDSIFKEFRKLLWDYYYNILMYTVYQSDFIYEVIVRQLDYIALLHKYLQDIYSKYIEPSKYLTDLYNEDCFEEWWIEANEADKDIIEKYKYSYNKPLEEVMLMLKNDASTDNAEKYFRKKGWGK